MKETGPDPVANRPVHQTLNLLSAQEEQNKSLARELHDVVCQKLAVLGMEIDAIERNPPDSAAELRTRLRQLSAKVSGLANTMHEISRQLHPAVLDDIGLAAALDGECRAFSELYGNRVMFHADGLMEPLPGDVALCLYRITQEGLRNIAKHAGGAEAWVTLTANTQEIVLSIEDSGLGFPHPSPPGGLGLISMQERVRVIQGVFSICSIPGKGTHVEVRVPHPVGRDVPPPRE